MKSFSAVALVLSLASSAALARDFHEERPCGPDAIRGPLRLLLIQGHRGADFRGSCRKHDDCYDTPRACRKKCDDKFLVSLLGSCKDSRRPRGCERKARLCFWLVDRFGERAYRLAQANPGTK